MHLDEAAPQEGGVGSEKAPAKAMGCVWVIRYAGDVGVVLRSRAGLTRILAVVVEVWEAFKLTVS